MSMKLSENQAEQWRLLYEEAMADPQWVAYCKDLDAERLIDQQEMVELLSNYLEGKRTTEQLRSEFDRKTRTEWNTFGLKGMSGAMFLNVLVKHVADEQTLAEQLRLVLRVPKDVRDGRERLGNFLHFLENVIASHQATKRQIQPTRSPFFISAWWHMQAPEQWPIFYPRTRQTFELEGIYTASQNPIDDYFTFRESFLSLASALELPSWTLEQLCVWYREGRDRKHILQIDGVENSGPTEVAGTNASPVSSVQVDERKNQRSSRMATPDLSQRDREDEQANGSHAHIQLVLAKIGHELGCRVWIAANDHGKIWKGKRLGDFSLKTLPNLWMDSEFQRVISLIDVLWIKGANNVAAAFEIEHTTSIYSGLLRMSDLVALSPNINFPLYIVTPENRLDKVRYELTRPTFQVLELHKRCGFFSEEKLLQNAEHIMKWANHPSAIEKLAFRVGDVEQEGAPRLRRDKFVSEEGDIEWM